MLQCTWVPIMRRTNLADLPCSLARSLQMVGERWTLLVLRDISLGWNRFDAIHEHIGIARNILKTRLDTLVEHEIVERVRYQEHPPRYEYAPTAKGRELMPILLAIVAWGDRWASPDGPPMLFTHETCGHDLVASVVCEACGGSFDLQTTSFRPGPGLS